jgi:outer membrane immunogenic protein
MTRRILVAATLALLSTTASAVDLLNYRPEPVMAAVPTFDWTGFHAGISGGYGFNADDPNYSYIDVPPDIVQLLPTSIDLSGDGGLIGGSVGYDKQLDWVVLGVEGDFSWTDFGGNATFLFPGSAPLFVPPLKFSTSYNVDWFSTVRGRVGGAFGRFLVYGTGGLAFADVALHETVAVGAPGSGALVGSEDETKTGWTVGGGAALAITDHITMKAEALYYDLGQVSLRATQPGNPSTQQVEQDVAGVIVQGGINYKF